MDVLPVQNCESIHFTVLYVKLPEGTNNNWAKSSIPSRFLNRFLLVLPSGVIKHGKPGNPKKSWRFIAGTIIYQWV
jgi:hypothetical protein